MFRKRRKTDARTLAYESLIKYQIHSLPVKVNDRTFNNIKFFSLQFVADYFHEPIEQLLPKAEYRGFIFYQTECDRYIVFLNTEDPEPLLRWSISVAIGYIESQSCSSHGACFFNSPGKYIEDFTYTFTCPDCVLEKNQIQTINDICRICRIPFPKALEKSKRLLLKSNQKDKTEVKFFDLLNNLIVIDKK